MSDTKAVQAAKPEGAPAPIPQSGFSRLPAVRGFAGNAAGSTIYLWISQGRFPRGVKLSPRVTVWRNEDLHQWAADPVAWQAAHMGA
ncbi:MAG: AlpA family transcriptional regulator [Castellaniella sp.]|nr:AlpA family transcriptional regulator [Castellaniella sp.]